MSPAVHETDMSDIAPVPRALLRRLWIAPTAGALSLALTTAQGVVREGYEAWHQAVSALSLGPGGWIQTLNLAGFGAAVLTTVPTWRRVLARGRGATAEHASYRVRGHLRARSARRPHALDVRASSPTGAWQPVHGVVSRLEWHRHAGRHRDNLQRRLERETESRLEENVMGSTNEQPFVMGLWGVRYQVKDVQRSIAFYTEALGFNLDRENLPAFGQVSIGGLKLILSGPGASGSRPTPDGRQQEPGGWNRVVLQVKDLPARIAELKSQGVRFRNEMEAGPGGRQIQVEDPDGNPVELFEPAG